MNLKNKYFSENSNVIFFLLFFIILISAVILRVFGIKFGLPYLYESDEPFFVTFAIRLIGEKTLDPQWYQHPGTTTLYSLAILYMAISLIGIVFGYYPNNEAFLAAYRNDPTLVYLSGRIMILVFSILCLLLVFLVARRISNRWAGLLAMTILAVNPLFVEYSRIIRTDIQMTFLLLICTWFCLNIIERNVWKDYILVGFFVGLAIATKYPAAFFFPTIIFSHFIARSFSWRAQKKLIATGVASVLGAFLGSPYLFINFKSVLQAITFENTDQKVGMAGSGFLPNLSYYFFSEFPVIFSFLGIVLFFLGLIFIIRSKNKSWNLIAFFPVVFLGTIALLNLRWARWMIPVLPFISIVISLMIFKIGDYIKIKTHSANLSLGITLLLSAIILIPIINKDLIRIRELRSVDTRTTSRDWIMDYIPEGSNLLLEVYSPQLPLSEYNFYVSKMGNIQEVNKTQYTHSNFQPTWVYCNVLGNIKNIDDVCKLNINYFIYTDFYQNYFVEAENFPEVVSTYKELFSYGEMVKEIKPVPGESQGPIIYIEKVTGCGK